MVLLLKKEKKMKRKPMSNKNSRKYFKKTSSPKKLNLTGASVAQRGGIRL